MGWHIFLGEEREKKKKLTTTLSLQYGLHVPLSFMCLYVNHRPK
jgi:hypothetical protein